MNQLLKVFAYHKNSDKKLDFVGLIDKKYVDYILQHLNIDPSHPVVYRADSKNPVSYNEKSNI